MIPEKTIKMREYHAHYNILYNNEMYFKNFVLFIIIIIKLHFFSKTQKKTDLQELQFFSSLLLRRKKTNVQFHGAVLANFIKRYAYTCIIFK